MSIRYLHVEKTLKKYYKKGLKVLEIGAGATQYEEVFEKSDYISSDIPESKYNEKIDIICRCEDLPFNDCEFDIVFCVAAFSVLWDIEICMKEVSRVLKKGGCFIVFDYSKRIQKRLKGHFCYTSNDLIKIFKKVNLKVEFERVADLNYFVNKPKKILWGIIAFILNDNIFKEVGHWRIFSAKK